MDQNMKNGLETQLQAAVGIFGSLQLCVDEGVTINSLVH